MSCAFHFAIMEFNIKRVTFPPIQNGNLNTSKYRNQLGKSRNLLEIFAAVDVTTARHLYGTFSAHTSTLSHTFPLFLARETG